MRCYSGRQQALHGESRHKVHAACYSSKGSFRDQSGRSLSTLLYGNTAYLLIFAHAQVLELLSTMTPDCSHTLQFVTVFVNWSFLVRGLINARNVMTTGQPSIHFPAMRAVIQNRTELVMQITDTGSSQS